MRPNKARYVTACQQILALGAVVAVLAPAANVISLDVVGTRPGAQVEGPAPEAATGQPAGLPGSKQPNGTARDAVAHSGAADADEEAQVEVDAVDPVVNEYELTAATTSSDDGVQARRSAPESNAGEDAEEDGSAGDGTEKVEVPEKAASTKPTEIVSDVEEVVGYGAVGVTWNHGEEVADDDVTVHVRTRTDGKWSTWTAVDYHDEHGPDAASTEGKQDRPGTDALLIGEVDEVQAKVVLAPGVTVPDDMKLAVIAPGSGKTETEAPAIDTEKLAGDAGKATAAGDAEGDVAAGSATEADPENDEGVIDSSEGDLALQASSHTQKPKIYSRAQWGANENMRDKGSLRYYEVHAGFVHHTVNANNYSRAQVPGIIRSIYAYHTQSRGWSDVGYNFLVDKFGRIWEGRYGGVDRPVVGAHTLGYNDYSFAMSAIGNFETAKPPAKMINAYARLFAWKLSLHGIDAASTSQRVGNRTFRAINGHRDAGSTACPGRYLYAKIPVIRSKAAQLQADWSGRDLATDVVSTAHPDILLRRASDKAGFALPTQGMLAWKRPKASSTGWGRYDTVVASPDVTGDRKADVLVREKGSSTVSIRPGNGAGGFGAPVISKRGFDGFDQITAAGDLNGNKGNDFVARRKSTGKLYIYRNRGNRGFKRAVASKDWKGYDLTIATGDTNGDGKADLYSRDTKGRLWLHPGTNSKKVGARVRVPGAWGDYDVITGFGDFNGDGKADLFARDAATKKGFVFPGKGDGTFGHWLGSFGRFGGRTHVSGANVSGTKDPDVLAVSGNELMVIAQRGTQNVGAPVRVAAKGYAKADAVLNVGDWDRDGHGDIITRNAANGRLKLIRGLGNNKFANAVTVGSGFKDVALLTAVGDTTGDGYPDLMGQPKGGAMRIYPGSPDGIRASYVARGSVSASRQVGVGRWNKDGAPDNLFRIGNRMVEYAGNGPGGLTGSPVSIKGPSLAPYDWVLGVGDIDGNGRPDLVVRNKVDGTLWMIPGRANRFASPKFLAEGYAGYDLGG